jgi:hypothetical protein
MAAVVEGCCTAGALPMLELFFIDTHGPRGNTRTHWRRPWVIRKLAIRLSGYTQNTPPSPPHSSSQIPKEKQANAVQIVQLHKRVACNYHSSIRVSCARPRTLLLLLFFEMFIKLNRFFTLPFLLVSLFPLFMLLLVSGLPTLASLCALVWLRLDWLALRDGWNAGSASGPGELGVTGAVLRKLRLSRLRLVSLLALRLGVVVGESSCSCAGCVSALASLSFSGSPMSDPFVRKARLSRFLCVGLAPGTGDITLVPLIWWSSGVVLAI